MRFGHRKEKMIVLSILLALAAAAVWKILDLGGYERLLAKALAGLSAANLIFSSITIVPAGHVGVVVTFGKVSATELAEGFHLVNPLADVEKLSIRVEKQF